MSFVANAGAQGEFRQQLRFTFDELMSRPKDEEHYTDRRTEHVAQGDIFRSVPFHFAMPPTIRKGILKRHLAEPPSFVGYGILINYTSGMMKGGEGTRGYSHDFRILAPIMPIQALEEKSSLSDAQVHQLRVNLREQIQQCDACQERRRARAKSQDW
jgi:hypothetical protein